jgi:hypothetical protein
VDDGHGRGRAAPGRRAAAQRGAADPRPLKFRVGSLVFVSISPDETSMGFGFPKEDRAALVASEPEKFHMPVASDERYNWVRVWLAAIDEAEMRELVLDAWRMVVPKRVAAAYLDP